MMIHGNSIFDIFVKKISEKKGKFLTRNALMHLWVISGGSKHRFPYALGKIKNQSYLYPLGGGIFYVSDIAPDFDDCYWTVVSLLIEQYSPSGGIIAHEKSMEYHLRNYAIPENLVIYTRDLDKRIQIGSYHVHFRTLKTGEKTGTKNMYRIFSDMSRVGKIDGMELRFLSLESSLLDVASLRIHESGIAEDLILQFLQRYEKELSREKLGLLVSYRYIRAINRVRALSKTHGFMRIYDISLDIIKREGGGCYLNL